MKPAVVLLNRDLRVADHPALAAAARGGRPVVPLFVFDDRILGSGFAAPNRVGFLLEALADLRESLRSRGAELTVRRGDPVTETVQVARQVGADTVLVTADVGGYAQARERRLAAACQAERLAFEACPGTTIVPAGALVPHGGDHYKVFTPYFRAWSAVPWRPLVATPRQLARPDGRLAAGDIPSLQSLVKGDRSPHTAGGGETAARKLMAGWRRSRLDAYEDHHDDLAGDRTSRLSPYLHFGCVSALELALGAREAGGPGGAAFVRQLCWRDFHHQVTAAFPALASEDYRPRGKPWVSDDEALAAWKEGQTGLPIVDAGMRQLAREGWMHNRARLITAAYLTKSLGLDWRLGAQHFLDLLLDGDIANNSGNWQWVAGTGNDTRPNRTFNPQRQAQRFDSDGEYVRRYAEPTDAGS